jgi:SAM-dependent methyltransferase
MMSILKRLIDKILRAIQPKHGIFYWKKRAKKFGFRSVFNITHTESELAEVTAMQIREIFPHFLSSLKGDEKIVLDFGCGPGRFTTKLAETIHGKAIGVDPVKELLVLTPPPPPPAWCHCIIQANEKKPHSPPRQFR